MSEVKPCPFCGPQGKPVVDDDLAPHHCDVYCEECGVMVAHISNWNNRPEESRLLGLLGEIETWERDARCGQYDSDSKCPTHYLRFILERIDTAKGAENGRPIQEVDG